MGVAEMWHGVERGMMMAQEMGLGSEEGHLDRPWH